jgi:F-type H+-transporting ATPase subunit b
MHALQVIGAGGGDFLVKPGVGVMVWTLIAFGVTILLLRKFAFPPIQEALDKRRVTIEQSIEHAEQTRKEADALLREYRERLREAREQADDIVVRARRGAEKVHEDAIVEAKRSREEMMEQTRRDIQQETRRALDQIRSEVADLTVLATEKVTRKTLDDADHRRLIEEALEEFDFSELAGDERTGAATNGGERS